MTEMATTTDDELYETETMAELCARQGRPHEAMVIFRRLCDTHPRSQRRPRWAARLEALERAFGPATAEIPADAVPLPAAPGVTVVAREHDDAQGGITVAWALPTDTPEPTLELLLIQKTPSGVETNKRTVALTTYEGRLAFAVPALHSALAAVGGKSRGTFIAAAVSRS